MRSLRLLAAFSCLIGQQIAVFWDECWNMPIPWCASLHAQSWCGASFQAGALHSFWLEAHTDSLTGKCLDYVVLRLYAIWVKLNEQHLWHIVFFFVFLEWMNGIRVLWGFFMSISFWIYDSVIVNKITKCKGMHKYLQFNMKILQSMGPWVIFKL